MFRPQSYLERLTDLLVKAYGERLLYVGLQGSYLRDEANEQSDIDIMAVVDKLSVEDLNTYRTAIESLENVEQSCGFICSKADLIHWNPLELCHLLHSTKDHYGVLRELVPSYSREDIKNFIKFSANNLYHEICHRMIHSSKEKNRQKLMGSYRSVFFILQNFYYLQTGRFIQTKAELPSLLSSKDREVFERSLASSNEVDFEKDFSLLFYWCQDLLVRVDELS